MEGLTGIEPALSAWEAGYQRRDYRGITGLPRAALPASTPD